MRIECVTEMGRIKALAPRWKKILDNSQNREIFLLPEWYLSYWKTFPENGAVCFLLFHDTDLVGLLPLCLTRRGPFRELRFFGQPHFIHRSDFIVAPGREEACMAAFADWLRKRRDWDIVSFRNFGLFSDNGRKLTECCRRRGLHGRIRAGSVNYYLTTDAYADYGDYWKSRFHGGRRKKIKNLRNRLERYPSVAWRVEDQLHGDFLEKIAEIDTQKSNGDATGRSFFAFPGKTRFFRELSKSLSETGVLRCIALFVEEKLVSYAVVFPYGRKLFGYQTAYDSDFSVVSPGTHILLKTIESAIESGMEELDMLVGDQAYKAVFTSQFRKGEHFLIFNHNLRSALLRGWYDWIKPAAINVRERFPRLREALARYKKRRITRGNE